MYTVSSYPYFAFLPFCLPPLMAAARRGATPDEIKTAYRGRFIDLPERSRVEFAMAIGGPAPKARLIEHGSDYDASVLEADRLCRDEGLTLIHSTNNRDILAGAATITLTDGQVAQLSSAKIPI